MNVFTSLKLLGFPWEASSCFQWCRFEVLLRSGLHQINHLWPPTLVTRSSRKPASRTSAGLAALNGVSDKVSWLQNGIIFGLCWIFTRSEMPSSGLVQLDHFIRNALLLVKVMFGSKTWRVWTERKLLLSSSERIIEFFSPSQAKSQNPQIFALFNVFHPQTAITYLCYFNKH